jgi:transposase
VEQQQRALMVTAAQQAAVDHRLRRTDLRRRERQRLEMVKGAAQGWDRTAIARWSGLQETTVQRWLDRFVAGGVDALRDAPRTGRPPKADAAYRAALEQALASVPPALGLPFDVWTSPRLSAYLAETTGVRIAPGWLRALLAERDWVSGRPKHTLYHLQDAHEVAACAQTLADLGEKGAR